MLGEKLKELREAKGLVQRQVATGNSQNEIGESYT
jgi:transcriptional regulator with XRE-family HTH domain